MKIHIRKFTPVAATIAFLIAGTAPVLAQTPASEPVAQDAKATAMEAKKQARKDARAKRKAEHKAARAKNTAEIKKLEGAGYNPTAGDSTSYPQNLQNAEKKATAPSGASQ
ncbi:DUF4148 domain-containing protein [Burkholderia guangdongensis]|uniref:DUF4148 domain-containing protein n=1 Tax=Burkholderia guangdongensis TaxID=1792500 RepID=UPI0015C9E6B8|nr:DUF4148 domain-containing protein [Burkholderia guangdongensis]